MKVRISDAQAKILSQGVITSGMIGRTLDLEFTQDWDGLDVVACFIAGNVTETVSVAPVSRLATISIPSTLLQAAGVRLSVGFRGTREEQQEGHTVTVLTIPTIYAVLGIIQKGATPAGEIARVGRPL